MSFFKKSENESTKSESTQKETENKSDQSNENVLALKQNAIEEALKAMQLKYQLQTFADEAVVFQLAFKTEKISQIRFKIILTQNGVVNFISDPIASVPAEKRAAVLSELNRMNGQYRYGKYYIDNDGDVLLQQAVSVLLGPKQLSDELSLLIKLSLEMLDGEYPAIMKAIWS